MRGTLLALIHVFSGTNALPQDDPGGSLANIQWLNIQKHHLFLNPEEIYFDIEHVSISEGDAESLIRWKDIEYFLYPYVGLNIEVPGSPHGHYFSLILKEEKESAPLLSEFISRLNRQSGKRPFR